MELRIGVVAVFVAVIAALTAHILEETEKPVCEGTVWQHSSSSQGVFSYVVYLF